VLLALPLFLSGSSAFDDDNWLKSTDVKIFKGGQFLDQFQRDENQGSVLAFLTQGLPSKVLGAAGKRYTVGKTYTVDGVTADLRRYPLVSEAIVGDQVSMTAPLDDIAQEERYSYHFRFSTHTANGFSTVQDAVRSLKESGRIAMTADAVWVRIHKPEGEADGEAGSVEAE